MDSALIMRSALIHGRRNSYIEALRLLAMFAMALNHFPWDYSALSAAGSKGLWLSLFSICCLTSAECLDAACLFSL